MDIKFVNPFLDAFLNVMPQLGFTNIEKKSLSVKGRTIQSIGVMLIVGLIGDIKGNVAYGIDIESAKKIASTMMMGMPVTELDDMAKSAISELSNMVTANASTNLSNMGTNVNISTPTLMVGTEFEAKMNTDKVLCVELLVDGNLIQVNIAFE